ncbi:putative ABC transport system permease protein [Tamaricihabitans halophyticus]|uniref:Putative ABC transport system permease protein n=1 Tax=Tamaricihabitans halophyticus TaxID=1262583 RepID=A0A4R2R102_9PSEU|nr:FtsX-like permease family protein [Tamaricihabitans halophyticus]TCP56340.1 putative ABC transport system permease protein [Tamaricihabitans halophyticus]
MFGIALRTLRKRTGSFVATFIALLFGTALVVGCAGLLESGITTAVAPQRLAEAPVVVTGAQSFQLPQDDPDAPRDPDDELDTQEATLPERMRLDPNLVSTLKKVPGVAEAVGDISFPTTVAGDGVATTGHGWDSAALTPYRLDAGTPPGSGDVVLDRDTAERTGLTVGDRADVSARGDSTGFRVSGIAAPEAGNTPSTSALFFTGTDAERLSGNTGNVDAIGVLSQPGTNRAELSAAIESALAGTPATVLTGDERGLAEFPEAQDRSVDLISLSAVSGGMATAVAMFVVASTMTLSIQHRRRELALLRAIGATPGQARRMVIGETLVTALLAGALAVLPGILLGDRLFGQLTANGVVPQAMEYRQSWISVLSGAGAVLLAALLAAWVSGRRAAQSRPVDALTDAAIPRRWVTAFRVITAILCFGGGLALFIVTVAVMTGPVAASTAGPSVLLWAIGLAMISPGATRIAAAVLRPLLRLVTGAGGYLAVLNARSRVVLVASAVTPIMLAVGVTTANIYLQTTQDEMSERARTESLRADAVVNSAPSGLPADLLPKIQSLPGVAGASETADSRVFVVDPFEGTQDDEGFPALGLTGSGAAATTSIRLTEGDLADLTGNTVVLPSEYAKILGRGVGDTITLRMGDGSTEDVQVVGIADQSEDEDQRFLLPARLLAAHTTDGVATTILVRAERSTDPARLLTSVRQLTADQPGIAVSDRAAVLATQAEDQRTGAWVNYLMSAMITAYTVIAVANTLVMATARRRREFGLQRLTGSTRAQVMRMMGIEGVLVALIGILLGTVVAALGIMPFTLVASDSIMPSGPLWIYLTIVGIAGLLTLLATLAPTWSATRAAPVEATNDLS